MLKEATRTLLMNSLASKDVSQMLAVSANLGHDLVALISSQKNIMNDLLATLTHDYTTFTHITNVCTYCIVLAEAYGIRDQSQLIQIAQGGLLHDLGKCFIPPQILNKATRLTPEEEDLIRQHPVGGFNELCMRPEVSWGQLMMVYQHHERFNGGGYPVGLVGNEIHLWGRLCAVADVYDALTRDRPYRRGVAARQVLEYLDHESGRSFDEELTQCWIAILEKCPK
jgi:HD-GYP domain-containing protein (c-di-GMP phosphodiesterase class II)